MADDPLGPMTELPGTGVRLRPPSGAELLPLGPGLAIPDERAVITIAIRDGDRSIRDELLGALEHGEGADVRHRTIDGRAATLVRDAVSSADGTLARLALVADAEGRVLLVTATSAPSESAEATLERSLATVRWNATAPLDPAAAIGLHVDGGADLVVDTGTVSVLVLEGRGASSPPALGDPTLTFLPVARPPPPRGDQRACAALLEESRALDAPVESATAIEESALFGCEATGLVEREPSMTLRGYAALLVLDVGPFLAVGSVADAGGEVWIERFRAAARSLRQTRQSGR